MKLELFGAFLLSTAIVASLPAKAQDGSETPDILFDGTIGGPFGAFDEPSPTQLFIDLKDDTTDEDEKAIEAELGGIDIRLNSVWSTDERFFIADVDPSMLDVMIRELAGDPRVEHVEPNYVYEMLEADFPNDPLY